MRTIEKEITMKLENGMEVTTEVTAHMFKDNYGSDYDGNRGVDMWFIDEFSYEIPDTDDRGFRLTDNEKNEFERFLQFEINATDWEVENG